MYLTNCFPIKKHLFLLTAILLLLNGAGCVGLSAGQPAPQNEGENSGESDLYLPVVVTPPAVPELIETIPLTGQPSPDGVLINSRTNQVYVLEGARVALIEGTQLLKEIPLPRPVLSGRVALDEENDRFYVSYGIQSEESVITVIEKGDKVTHIPLPYVKVLFMTIHPETQELYIAGMRVIDGEYAYSELIIIRDNEIISRLDIGRMVPRDISIDILNNYVYVSGGAAHPELEFETIGVIKVIQNNELIKTLTMGQYVYDMAIDAETGELLVVLSPSRSRNEDSLGIRLEDTVIVNKGEILLMQNLGGQGYVTYKYIIRHPLVDNFFYIDARGKIVAGQKTEDGMTIVAEIEVGSPGEVLPNDFDIESGNLYRANYQDDTVSVINGTENIGTIAVGGGPMGLAVNPNNGWVYVGNNRGWSVSVLGYPTLSEGN